MTTRIVALLIAVATLGGLLGVGFLKRKPSSTPTPPHRSLAVRPHIAPPHIPHLPHMHLPEPDKMRPATLRIAVLVIAAAILGTGSYIGLDGDSGVHTTSAISSAPLTSFQNSALAQAEARAIDDLEAKAFARELAENRTSRLSPPAAPTPAPVQETPAPTPIPTPEPPPPPPAETRTPAVAQVIEYPAGSLEAIICSMPWPCGEAISVASCESGLDRNGNLDGNWATNGDNHGLFQINSIHAYRWPDYWTAWMDPVRNTQFAYDIWAESGWRPWHCQPY